MAGSGRVSGLPDRVETVLLDAGGVLLDLDYDYLARLLDVRGCRVATAELSRLEAVARTEIHRHVSAGGRVSDAWRDYFRIILGRLAIDVEHQESIIDSLWEAHLRFGLWTVPIDEAVETVAELKRRGYRLGVVSNAEGRVAVDLDGAGFEGMFEIVLDSHHEGVEKPDPAIFLRALERMGASAATAVFVGDVPAVDVAGAAAAGLAPILLDRHRLYDQVSAPRIASIVELPDLLERT